jgi:hypothetical protein
MHLFENHTNIFVLVLVILRYHFVSVMVKLGVFLGVRVICIECRISSDEVPRLLCRDGHYIVLDCVFKEKGYARETF